MSRETMRQAKRVVGLIVAVVAALALSTAVAYGLTAWMFVYVARPPDLVVQVANTVLGFLLFALAASLISRRAIPRQQRWLDILIDAIDRMTKGDFSVRLETDRDSGGAFGDLYRSVNQMAVELDQLEQMRQEFISNVSHEIQSPLTSIRGFARALRDDPGPETRERYLAIIESECVRLSQLSDNLLELASLDSGRRAPARQTYRLDQQISSQILACEPQWSEKNLELDTDLEALEITADEGLLGQVWQNLLHNSIKFTDAGGGLRVTLRGHGDKAEVKVADTGRGIAPEDLPHVFDRFFKGDRARQRSAGGAGLGLAIVHKIVELHEGRIDIQSRPGHGTTLTITLPLLPTTAAT